MLDGNTISQLVSVVMMVAPSASDQHLENHSRETIYQFHVESGAHELALWDACEELATAFNQLDLWVMYQDTLQQPHAWCKGIYK
ncbi:hypothetical protein [Roseovarius Plymouth podovirus 1]|uniref:Uncharacterized protein n=2 Tax=Roseovarius Plymouth podovirus 1 TaxID=926474 RepID=K4Q4X8_9CAUD|nr:hypothetical protein HYO70_gp01 [Roseovarius Plymouth podovirus 1]CBW46995.1 hypothetical protein [Roseovarius sp. 217 phage 1]CBX87931.1 hypothetical protein [Roseovarius Plymouth podovirus 1]